MSDTKNYDYPVILAAQKDIRETVTQVEEKANGLIKGAQALNEAGWKGDPADAYFETAGVLKGRLGGFNQVITDLEASVQKAVEGMQQTDEGGKKRMTLS
ncbi:WXG100 family type VII secretion target [Saccharopolyspora sp. NPDC002686]|uniref:WXG100 family type VII secretion target n=1 Tax=Saccharopolyspora sp. NPDC002686 TaxID=3154541 RepID=UPI0033315594